MEGIVSGFGFAGGGGSDSGGDYGGDSDWGSDYNGYDYSSDGSGHYNLNTPFFGILIFIVFLIVISMLKKREINRTDNNPTPSDDSKLQAMALLADSDYNSSDREKWIHEKAAEIFVAYQDDWSNFRIENIKTYTSGRYFEHASLMLEALKDAGRQNKVSDLKLIKTSLPYSVKDNDALPMKVKVLFKFSGLDEVIDTKTGGILYSDHSYGIFEMWNFLYDGESLKLDEIKQPTESASHLMAELANFADENGLFYSPDWGRYILPNRGLIFSNDSLSVADVNNHVIGKWGNSLVQIYTYAKNPDIPEAYYLVGQLNIPKLYEGIIVESREASLVAAKVPGDYEEFDTEWDDFNRQYRVYAAKRDAVSAFELVNPQFMENLYDENLHYNLEVVDNAIYIFAKITEANEEDFKKLLGILSLAYKELER